MKSIFKSKEENIIFQRSPAGIVLLDQNGFIFQVNNKAVEIFGENIKCKKWVDLLACSLELSDNNSIFIRLTNGKIVSIATESLYPQLGQMIVIWDETAFSLYYENKVTQQKVEGLSKLVASMAHQLRTPLTTALIYSGNLQKKIKQNSSNEFNLINDHKKLQDQLKHLQFLIDDMFIYAKGGHGVVSEVYIEDIINEAIETVSGIVDNNKIILFNSIEECNKYKYIIMGNKESLVGSFANLIINAYQACLNIDQKFKIKIEISKVTRNKKKYIQVNIVDNGIGIPEEIKNKIFEPFFTTKKTGTGVGLFVVQSAVMAHKGEIDFSSFEFKGSTFSVKLPVLEKKEFKKS